LYGAKGNKWEYIGGKVHDNIVAADIDLSNYVNEKNEATFAVMGIICINCLNSSLNLVYEPSAGTDHAVIMVHGLSSSPETYKEIIVIEDIKKISLKIDHGPLAIDSEQDGYKLSWIIAPTGGLVKKINISAIRNYFRNSISSFRYNFINRPREAMLRLIAVINDLDQQLRPIILWLNYRELQKTLHNC